MPHNDIRDTWRPAVIHGASTPNVAGLYHFIGNRVRSIRDDREMTQEELAAAANISRASITQFESGQQRLPLETLYLVASGLSVGIDQILPTFADLSPPQGDIIHQLSTDAELSDDERVALQEFFQAVAKQGTR